MMAKSKQKAGKTVDRAELNRNLAQMLKGGVIMDVTNPEQAKIAQEAGAVAVMALERVPADIRKELRFVEVEHMDEVLKEALVK